MQYEYIYMYEEESMMKESIGTNWVASMDHGCAFEAWKSHDLTRLVVIGRIKWSERKRALYLIIGKIYQMIF